MKYPGYLKRIVNSLFRRCGIELIGFRRRPAYDGEKDRYSYQSRLHDFKIGKEEKVLDVGCGDNPFPPATMLVDCYTQKTRHRHTELRTDGKPFIVADINRLPFGDKSYDFVCCSHVLEHVDDPGRACSELVRVGRRGYIETPSLMTDVLFSWAKDMHKWFTVAIGNRLVFFEYGPRLIEGVRDSYWAQSVFSKKHHPIQDLFFKNQDIFNSALIWHGRFEYTVFRQDGSVENSDMMPRDLNKDKQGARSL
jgi:SAM-dependent methyltransferase